MCCGVRGTAAGRRPKDDPAPWGGSLAAWAARWTPILPARTQFGAHVTVLEMESPVPYDPNVSETQIILKPPVAMWGASGDHPMIPLVSDALGNDLNMYTEVFTRKRESHIPEFNVWPGSKKKHSQAHHGLFCE